MSDDKCTMAENCNRLLTERDEARAVAYALLKTQRENSICSTHPFREMESEVQRWEPEYDKRYER